MPEVPSIRDAVAFVTEALKTRGAVLNLYASVRDYFRKTNEPGERPILVLGPGGVGKTTLARILAGEYSWIADPVGPYVESLNVEKTLYAGSPGVEVITAPGQPDRQTMTWSGLLAQVAGGEYRGVVLLTAAGYHTLPERTGYRDLPAYANDKQRLLKDYFAERRAEELTALRLLSPHLHVCAKPIWLLVVVAKQDLWVGDQPEVSQFYSSGDFAAAVRGIAVGKDARTFRYELAFVSLVINSLTDRNGDVLAKNTAGYDQPQQAASLVRLLNTIAHLKAWEDTL